MKKSIIAVIVLSSVASFAANAASNAADFAAAYNQFQHGATLFETLPTDAPINQVTDAYAEAKAGLARMGVHSADMDDVIANHNNYKSSETISSWVGYDLYGKQEVSAPVVTTTGVKGDQNLTSQISGTVTPTLVSMKDATVTPETNQKTPSVSGSNYRDAVTNKQAVLVAPTLKSPTPVSQKTPVAHTQLTPSKNGINGVDGVNGSNGKDGVNGNNGKDGVNGKDGATGSMSKKQINQMNGNTKAIDTLVDAHNENVTAIDTNTAGVAANRSEIISHSRAIASNRAGIERNSAAIAKNSQRIDRNSKDIAENRKAIKRVGAMASAASNLHYNRAENGYAVSVGEYAGSTAVAGGVQFNTSANTAVTVQASYDGENVGASVGFHGSW